MAIDVTADAVIHRPLAEVAGYATDPDHETQWIGGIKQSRRLSGGPVSKGTRVERLAMFLGKRIDYVLEAVEYEPDRRIVMRSVKSPFPMDVTYEFEPADDATRMRIRIQGGPTGLMGLMAPLTAAAVKRNITADLRNLKRILESYK
jgi:hypothetical protein